MKTNLSCLCVIMILTIVRLHAQPANGYIKDYAPPSPTAAIMQKNINIPVNTFNGTASISIPIHTITEGPLSAAINLSYNTSGIKLGEMASWVGLGWYLNAGGMVSRSVVGLEDDHIHGYMSGECEDNYNTQSYDQIATSTMDCQPDIYYLSFGSYSAKMVYAPHLDADGGWYIYPKSDLAVKAIMTGITITGFKITAPDGTVYTFGNGAVEKTEVSSSPQIGTGNMPYITSWYLQKITSHDGLHSITYTYEDEHTRYTSLGSNYEYSTAISTSMCTSAGGNSTTVQPMYSFVDGKRLSSITTSTGLETVTFVAETSERQDVTQSSNPLKTKALDKINITSSAYCTTYDFTYHYSQSSGGTAPEYKRLILDALQEKSCNNSFTIPAYTFTYTDADALPQRLSKQVDHWGYYNGKAANEGLTTLIPNNASVVYNNVTYYYNGNNANGCNRNVDSLMARKASLASIIYPNGGTTTLQLESNTEYGLRRSGVYETPVHNKYSNCNSNPNFNYIGPCKAFTATELTKAQLKLDMDLSGNGNGCPATPPRFNIKVTAIEDVSSGTPLTSIYNYTINMPSAFETTGWLDMASIFQPALSPNVPYFFQMSIEPGPFYGEGDVQLYVQYIPEENNAVAGLRVKTIESTESAGATPISTHYTYDDALGHSTGVVLIEPRYGYVNLIANQIVVLVKKFTSFPLVSTTDLNGHQVGYKEVKVWRTGAGYDIHRFKAVKQISTSLPVVPLPTIYDNGLMSSVQTYTDAPLLIKRDSQLYSVPNMSGLVAGPSSQYFVEKIACDNVNFYMHDNDVLEVPSYARPSTIYHMMDGQTTSYSYTYDPQERVIDKATETVVNADGKTYLTEYKYAHSYPTATIRDSLLSKNMIYPAWQTTKKVNLTVVDGQQTTYSYYTVAGLATTSSTKRLYPYELARYEMTWDASGNASALGWQPHTTIDEYDDLYFKPAKVSKSSYALPILMSYYSNGTLQSIQYSDHSQSYTYQANTSLLATSVAIDSQVTSYTYDGLKRLLLQSERGGNATTSYDYHYRDVSDVRNWVKTIRGFAVTPGSALQKLESKTFYDGIGRPSLELMVDHSPALKDVAIAYRYDVHGRPSDTTIPVESSSSGGTYFIVSPSTPKTVVQYEPSSLDRPASTTPPSWYASLSSYSSNASSLTAPWGTVYPASSLSTATATDADGRVAIQYKDNIGQVVLVRQCSSNMSSCADTWTRYDDKGRVSRVYPPGATSTTSKLWYSYTYDTDDNVVTKTIPGSNIEEYVYDSKNLLIGRRNPVLLANAKWLVYHYDVYNRHIKSGLHNLAGLLPATPSPTIHTLLEENHYDGFNGTSTNAAAIYKGKLKKKSIKALEDLGTNTTWQEAEYFYDTYGRVSSTTGINHRGSTETRAMTYDMADNVLTESHTIAGAGGVTHIMTHTYDDQGRLIDDVINVDGDGPRTLATQVYNHRDEVIERNIGRFINYGTHQYLQSLDYTYNAQGWLTKINELFTGTLPSGPDPCTGSGTATRESSESSEVTNTDDEDLFALKLDYDSPVLGQPINKNGNITGQTWHHKGRYPQSYGYTYDYLNRVIDAKHFDDANYSMAPERYTEKLAYDIRGNITSLRRLGVTNRTDINTGCYSVATIDSLTYTYDSNSNILSKIEDKAPCPDVITLPAEVDRDVHYAANQKIIVDHTTVDCHADLHLTVGNLPTYKKIEVLDSFKIPASCATAPTVRTDVGPCPQDHYTPGFNQQSTGSYVHDNSGNMTYDPHKKLTFYYNHLNLPYKIVGAESDELQLLYASDGTLLQRKYIQNNVIKNKIDYIFGKEYHNDTLEYIHHKDGRIIKHNATWQYEYSIKDHLGNIRATFCDLNGNGIISNNERRSRVDYYTFGMEHYNSYTDIEYGASKNQYKYNGKEKVDEMGWGDLLYGARNYNATIGRFTSIDALSDEPEQIDKSPYAYAWNDPVRLNDPDGNCPICPAIIAGAEVAWTWIQRRAVTEGAKQLWSLIADKPSAMIPIQTSTAGQMIQDNVKVEMILKNESNEPIPIYIDGDKHPESAEHGKESLENDIENKGVIDRKGASERRKENLKGIPTEPGKDRDEFPPAVIDTKSKVSVRHISSSDNRGAGSSIGKQIKNLPDGTPVIIIPKPPSIKLPKDIQGS